MSTPIFSNLLYLQAILATIFTYLKKGFPKAISEGIVKGLLIGFADLFFDSFRGRWRDYPPAQRFRDEYFVLQLGDAGNLASPISPEERRTRTNKALEQSRALFLGY